MIDGVTLWVETKEGDEDLVEDPTLEELGIELEGYDDDTEVQFRIDPREYAKEPASTALPAVTTQEVKKLGKVLKTTSIGEGEDEIKLVVRGHGRLGLARTLRRDGQGKRSQGPKVVVTRGGCQVIEEQNCGKSSRGTQRDFGGAKLSWRFKRLASPVTP